MENQNSVAFIAKITKLSPIEGANKIELATLEGWTSIVQKNIHKEGDLVLCITTDAVISQDLCDKWGITSYLRKGNRVRTVKLKGVYSECILIPWESRELKNPEYKEGEDLMDELGIFKYEPPAIITQDSKGRKHKYHQNPNFHIYYKFPNQKNTPNMFNEEDDVVITRKIHGTNARYGIVKKSKLSILDKVKRFLYKTFYYTVPYDWKYIEYEYVYGSHNKEKGSDSQGFYSTDVWKNIADVYNIKNELWTIVKDIPLDILGEGYIIYGEIYGPGIQGDKYSYNRTNIDILAFDVELNGKYVPHYEEGNKYCFEELSIFNRVPVLYEGKWSKEIQDSFVNNQFIEGTKIPHEGIVVKCISGDRKKISKVINPDYLIFGERNSIPDSH